MGWCPAHAGGGILGAAVRAIAAGLASRSPPDQRSRRPSTCRPLAHHRDHALELVDQADQADQLQQLTGAELQGQLLHKNLSDALQPRDLHGRLLHHRRIVFRLAGAHQEG